MAASVTVVRMALPTFSCLISCFFLSISPEPRRSLTCSLYWMHGRGEGVASVDCPQRGRGEGSRGEGGLTISRYWPSNSYDQPCSRRAAVEVKMCSMARGIMPTLSGVCTRGKGQ